LTRLYSWKWNKWVDKLDTMRIFVAVAEEEGFGRASRRLSLSPPAVTRAVVALERRLGAALLHRTTRKVRLTEAGSRFLADCRRILGELEAAEAAAAGEHAELRGQIGITASVVFGRMYVAPLLFDFLARHPRVMARTLFVDRIVDLIDEGLDIAVRIAHLPDSALHAVPVGTVRRVVCAAPAFLAAHGEPRAPADLARFSAIAFSIGGDAPEPWSFASGESVRPRSQLLANSNDVAIAGAVAGHGLARVLSYQIAPQLRAGELRLVLEAFEPTPVPVSLVTLEGRRAAPRMRRFLDFAVERLRAERF
jgi:DNA-binding transcriptional LysR family regulator